MRFADYIAIALKNIRRQKTRSFLTIVAIMIGATAVISLLSLAFSASAFMVNQLETAGALTMITVTSYGEVPTQNSAGGEGSFAISDLKIDDSLIDRLRDMPHVEGAGPLQDVTVFDSIRVEGGESSFRNYRLVAYEPGPITDKALLAGRNFSSDDSVSRVIIGYSFIRRFGYEGNPEDLLGRKVIFTTKRWYTGEGAALPPPEATEEERERFAETVYEIEAEIIGITVLGPEEDHVYMAMDWAKKLLVNRWWEEDQEKRQQFERQGVSYEPSDVAFIHTESSIERDGYSGAMVRVDDPVHVDTVAGQINEMGFGVITAQSIVNTFSTIIQVVGAVLGSIAAISLGVAAIGIVNTMIMSMYERTREIGIMRACGAKKATIRRLFAFEAVLLGLIGGVLGVLAGIALTRAAGYFSSTALEAQNIAALGNAIRIPPWLMLGTVALTALLGYISGLLPAARAAGLDPVEALKFE